MVGGVPCIPAPPFSAFAPHIPGILIRCADGAGLRGRGDLSGTGAPPAAPRAAAVAGDPPTHRGGFGEFGGDSAGLIDRSFRERIVLVALADSGDPAEADASLDELSLLVDTAGADAVARVCQRRAAPDPATFVGCRESP